MSIKGILLSVWGFITAACAVVAAVLFGKNKDQKKQIDILNDTLDKVEESRKLKENFDRIQREENEKKQKNLDNLDNGKPVSSIMQDLRKNSRDRVRSDN